MRFDAGQIFNILNGKAVHGTNVGRDEVFNCFDSVYPVMDLIAFEKQINACIISDTGILKSDCSLSVYNKTF